MKWMAFDEMIAVSASIWTLWSSNTYTFITKFAFYFISHTISHIHHRPKKTPSHFNILFLSDHTPNQSAANNGKPEKPQAQNETRESEGVNEKSFSAVFALSFLHAFFIFFWFVVCGTLSKLEKCFFFVVSTRQTCSHCCCARDVCTLHDNTSIFLLSTFTR